MTGGYFHKQAFGRSVRGELYEHMQGECIIVSKAHEVNQNAFPKLDSRCFLAIKYGSEAMMKANASRGKDYGGGSIILTASGEISFQWGMICR